MEIILKNKANFFLAILRNLLFVFYTKLKKSNYKNKRCATNVKRRKKREKENELKKKKKEEGKLFYKDKEGKRERK